MQLFIWFVNSNIQNSLSTSIIGLAYGPIYPATLTLANDILPPDICMVSMAVMWVIFSYMEFFENLSKNRSANASIGAGVCCCTRS